jgi:hypothetical protein
VNPEISALAAKKIRKQSFQLNRDHPDQPALYAAHATLMREAMSREAKK